MTRLEIDKTSRTINATLELLGESHPLDILIAGYELTDDNRLRIQSITTSREWLTRLAHDYLQDRPFELPERAARALRMIL